jgi:hypothetical protein
MNKSTGPHSIRELQELTKELKYLRYFPATSNFDSADEVCCNVVPKDKAEVRKLKLELKDRFKKKHPHLVINVTSRPEEGFVLFEIKNGDEWGKMEKKHFDGAVIVERELEAMSGELGFNLTVPNEVAEHGFDPQKHD